MSQKPKPRIRVTAEALKKRVIREKKRKWDMQEINRLLDLLDYESYPHLSSMVIEIKGHHCFPIYREDFEDINEIFLFSWNRIEFAKKVNEYYRNKWERAKQKVKEANPWKPSSGEVVEFICGPLYDEWNLGLWHGTTLDEKQTVETNTSHIIKAAAVRRYGPRHEKLQTIMQSPESVTGGFIKNMTYTPLRVDEDKYNQEVGLLKRGDEIEYIPYPYNAYSEWQKGYFIRREAGKIWVSEDKDLRDGFIACIIRDVRKPAPKSVWQPAPGEMVEVWFANKWRRAIVNERNSPTDWCVFVPIGDVPMPYIFELNRIRRISPGTRQD